MTSQTIDADKARALVTELRRRAMRPISYTATTAYINAAKELARLIPKLPQPTQVEITAGDDAATIETLMDVIDQIEGITIRVINHAETEEGEPTAPKAKDLVDHLERAEGDDGLVGSSHPPRAGEWWQVRESFLGEGVGKLNEGVDFPWLVHFPDGQMDSFKTGNITPIARLVPDLSRREEA